MKDQFQVDNHKLMFHPERVFEWMKDHDKWETAKKIYPIYVEVSPVGSCNHRCTFCAIDYIGYQNRQIPSDLMKSRLSEMVQLGVKSVMFAGEGEPCLHKGLPKILDYCSEIGLDTSITTNMVPLTDNNVDSFVRNCTWIKTSINAGRPETYALIHQCNPSDFDLVIKNLEKAVQTKKRRGYPCTMGAQMVLLPENADEISMLAERLKHIGMDYLVVKPYSQHHSSLTRKYSDLDYRPYIHLEKELQSLNGDGFDIIFRLKTMSRTIEKKISFEKCQATPFFWAYIMSNGDVYGCSAYLEDEKFCYGNIAQSTFKEIWEGDRRKLNHHFVLNELSIKDCRHNCRMWSANQYLWETKYPQDHVNFI